MENLTAHQLLLGLDQFDTSVVLINLVAYIAGLILHVWQKTTSEQITVAQYWKMHMSESVTSIVALITTFASMTIFNADTPIYAYFAMAYFGDALFNKAPINLDITRGIDAASRSKRNPNRVVPDGKSCKIKCIIKLVVVITALAFTL